MSEKHEKHENEKVSRRYFVTACSALAGGVAYGKFGNSVTGL